MTLNPEEFVLSEQYIPVDPNTRAQSGEAGVTFRAEVYNDEGPVYATAYFPTVGAVIQHLQRYYGFEYGAYNVQFWRRQGTFIQLIKEIRMMFGLTALDGADHDWLLDTYQELNPEFAREQRYNLPGQTEEEELQEIVNPDASSEEAEPVSESTEAEGTPATVGHCMACGGWHENPKSMEDVMNALHDDIFSEAFSAQDRDRLRGTLYAGSFGPGVSIIRL